MHKHRTPTRSSCSYSNQKIFDIIYFIARHINVYIPRRRVWNICSSDVCWRLASVSTSSYTYQLRSTFTIMKNDWKHTSPRMVAWCPTHAGTAAAAYDLRLCPCESEWIRSSFHSYEQSIRFGWINLVCNLVDASVVRWNRGVYCAH